MVRSARTIGGRIATAALACLLCFPGETPRAASLGESAPHRCVGCATGNCAPGPVNYGHYRPIWRRWPIADRLAEDRREDAADIPPVEVPDPVDEVRSRPRTRSTEPTDGAIRPELPQTPGALDTTPSPEANGDPFRTRPESEAPDFLDDLPQFNDAGGPLGDEGRGMRGDEAGGVLGEVDVEPEDNDGFLDDLDLENDNVNPVDDLPGLRNFDDPVDLNDPPFGRNRLRTPKRLALNRPTTSRPSIQPALTIGGRTNALRPPSVLTVPDDAASKRSLDPPSFSTDDLIISPAGPIQRTSPGTVDQVAYQTVGHGAPSATIRERNPLRSRLRPGLHAPSQHATAAAQRPMPDVSRTPAAETDRRNVPRQNPLRRP